MSNISFTFLGTGTSQGVPVISCECETCRSNDIKDKRLRTSGLISINEKNIVIDTGPDFRQQMLNNHVKMVDAILFTHAHKDHIAGLDDIRAYNYKAQKPMDIYATHDVQEALKREYYYVFMEKTYPGIPKVQIHDLSDQSLHLFGEEIIPINVMHYQLPVKAFRVRNFAYITDANYISEEEMEKLKGVDTLVVNALRKEKHVSHFTLNEALELIKELDVQQAYLTHISHLMGPHEQVSTELPANVQIAYDGLKIDIA